MHDQHIAAKGHSPRKYTVEDHIKVYDSSHTVKLLIHINTYNCFVAKSISLSKDIIRTTVFYSLLQPLWPFIKYMF